MRFAAFYILWSVLTLLLGLLSPLMLPFRPACIWLTRLWNRLTLWLARVVGGMHVVLEGTEHIGQGAAIYASRHQSALDTFALWLALDNPAFVLKKELLSIPIFGWFLARTGPIAIDRSAGQKAVDQIAEQGKQKLEAGRNIVIFPQGTRQPPQAEPRYKEGGVQALASLGYPVVPVTLDTGLLWPKKGSKRSGTAMIRFCPPLPPNMQGDALMPALIEACESIKTR